MSKINMPTSLAKVSDLLQAISPEPRLAILLAVGGCEACVCHLEAILGQRQAYISQHLKALREAGLLSTRRVGKYIFYRLEKPEILEIVELAARLTDFNVSVIATRANLARATCVCPNCSAQ